IEYIWGRRCYNLRRRGFAALASMPALRALSVSCKNVDDSALALFPSFPSLAELMPMDVPDEGYRHIGRCERLESLVLMYCRDTTDRATEHIARLANLKNYFASYTLVTDRTPEILAGISSLETIGLSAIPGITNTGVAALARLPRLRELDLGGLRNVTPAITTVFGPQVRVHYHQCGRLPLFLSGLDREVIRVLGVEIDQRDERAALVHPDRGGLRDRCDFPSRGEKNRVSQSLDWSIERERPARDLVAGIVQRTAHLQVRALFV